MEGMRRDHPPNRSASASDPTQFNSIFKHTHLLAVLLSTSKTHTRIYTESVRAPFSASLGGRLPCLHSTTLISHSSCPFPFAACTVALWKWMDGCREPSQGERGREEKGGVGMDGWVGCTAQPLLTDPAEPTLCAGSATAEQQQHQILRATMAAATGSLGLIPAISPRRKQANPNLEPATWWPPWPVVSQRSGINQTNLLRHSMVVSPTAALRLSTRLCLLREAIVVILAPFQLPISLRPNKDPKGGTVPGAVRQYIWRRQFSRRRPILGCTQREIGQACVSQGEARRRPPEGQSKSCLDDWRSTKPRRLITSH